MSRYHIASIMLSHDESDDYWKGGPAVAERPGGGLGYQDIGHGDEDPDTVDTDDPRFPFFVVWAWVGGRVEHSGVMVPHVYEDMGEHISWGTPDGKPPDFGLGLHGGDGYAGKHPPTHSQLWGEWVNAGDGRPGTYKGRFEPDTGRLSIVKPDTPSAQHRDVPDAVMSALRAAFDNDETSIKQVHTF